MKNNFHEGELFFQRLMGVNFQTDSLPVMRKDNIPRTARIFLESLNFSVIALSTKDNDIFTSIVYGIDSFIEIIDTMKISISLKEYTHIPQTFFEKEEFNLGFIGLDFELAMRIRINGKAKIINNKIIIFVEEIYANCPKYINKRVLKGVYKNQGLKKIYKKEKLNQKMIDTISHADTFFLSSSHNENGNDVSHRGGEKGFVTIVSPSKLEFENKKGNNLFNTLGNIHTNPFINMLFIDFKNSDVYVIFGKAKTIEYKKETQVTFKTIVECIEITIHTHSFLLKYK